MTNDALTALEKLMNDARGYAIKFCHDPDQHNVRADTIRQALKSLEDERERLSKLVYAPGVWRCAKCNFTLLQSNLNMHNGTVTARDEPGTKCPNDGAPMWRVSWADQAKERGEDLDRIFSSKMALESERDRLKADLAEACEVIKSSQSALQLQHKWQSSDETYGLEVSPGQWIELNRGAEYADSSMCDKTSDALRRASQYLERIEQ